MACQLCLQGVNGHWVGSDGSDPLDRMLAVLTPAVEQLAHIVCSTAIEMFVPTPGDLPSTNAIGMLRQASKAIETTTVQARRREHGASSAAGGGDPHNRYHTGQSTAAVRPQRSSDRA